MDVIGKRRSVSPAALVAALASRRAKAALPKAPIQRPEAFAVRHEGTAGRFAWEIRRFGGVVLARGTEAFPDAATAAAAGRAALEECRPREGGAGLDPAPGGASWIS